MKPKVSIITPCYNGEKYLSYFLDSLLSQDYQGKVEFIFVNDGSTDDTEKIFAQYRPKIEEKNWDVKYIRQENKGAAKSIDSGLKLYTGDYLIYPDSDDIMYPNHITEKVKFMEEHKKYAMAYCIIDVIKEDNRKDIVKVLKYKPKKNHFKSLLENKNWMWCPIGVIIRSSALKDVLSDKGIYTGGTGSQNLQIHLPLAYSYPTGYINKTLGAYIVRASSHSRSTYSSNIHKQLAFWDIWVNTILRLKYASSYKKFKYILFETLFITKKILQTKIK